MASIKHLYCPDRSLVRNNDNAGYRIAANGFSKFDIEPANAVARKQRAALISWSIPS
jgi:hypothetical protein